MHRHLQELPSSVNGLSLTQSLLLQILAREAAGVGDLWRVSQGELEPMPFLGDTMFLHILNQMGRVHPAVYERSVLDPERPFSDRLAITQTGREVLQGVTDWLSLQPPLRWLGGVQISVNAELALGRGATGRYDGVSSATLPVVEGDAALAETGLAELPVARQNLTATRFYAAARCEPTRLC